MKKSSAWKLMKLIWGKGSTGSRRTDSEQKTQFFFLVNPIRTGGFPAGSRFLPITLEVIKVHSRNLVTFPKS